MGHFDFHKVAESLMCSVLRELYSWKGLKNLNVDGKKNFPSIDLADEELGVAVQITGSASLSKVKDTIEIFLEHELDTRYRRLVVYVLSHKQKSYSQESIDRSTQGRIAISAIDDILDFRDLCSRAEQCHPVQLEAALEALKAYCGESILVGHMPAMSLPQAKSFKVQQLSASERFIHLQDESVSLEIASPSSGEMNLSAVLSLAREDLKGVVVQISPQIHTSSATPRETP